MAAVDRHLEDTIYNVWCIKEPDYNMKILGTASGLRVSNNQEHHCHWSENGHKYLVTFKYQNHSTSI